MYTRVNYYHKYNYKYEKGGCYDTKFYAAIRKYGIESFRVFALEFTDDPEMLDEAEIFWIKKYNSFRGGYNSTPGGRTVSPNVRSKEAERKRVQTREENGSLKAEKHPRARLTNAEVLNIRKRFSSGETVEEINIDYPDYSLGTFRRIVFGLSYKSVGGIPDQSMKRLGNTPLRVIDVIEIRRLYDTKEMSIDQLCEKYGVLPLSIKRIVERISYANII